MSKELEALEVLGNTVIHHIDSCGNITNNKVSDSNEFKLIKQALERAKKVEELLDLYRLQQEFKERYNTQVRLLDRQETLDSIREIAEEIYLKEKELEELK